MASELPKISVAETLAGKIAALQSGTLPAATTRKCDDLLIDVVGLCVTARNQDYIASALAGSDDDGSCTVIGHARTLTAASARPPYGSLVVHNTLPVLGSSAAQPPEVVTLPSLSVQGWASVPLPRIGPALDEAT